MSGNDAASAGFAKRGIAAASVSKNRHIDAPRSPIFSETFASGSMWTLFSFCNISPLTSAEPAKMTKELHPLCEWAGTTVPGSNSSNNANGRVP